MAKTYYSQRASTPGTLLITEATFISSESRGRDKNAPGIYNTDQIAGWRTVVEAVHQHNSFIFCQLWHVGRAGRMGEIQRLDLPCLSSSNVPIVTTRTSSSADQLSQDEYAVPRAMTEEDIQNTIASFAQAASNAVHVAGFDGVEIHAANGYLIDQFIQPCVNQRVDAWGGSIEKRARFCLEVVNAVCRAIGSERTGVRLSPFSRFQGMGMKNPVPQFQYLIEELSKMGLAYVHLIEPRISGNMDRDQDDTESLEFAINAWNRAGPVILAGGYTPITAEQAVKENYAAQDVMIAFGRHFISNPDLPRRILSGLELAPYDRATFYTAQSARGYTDYPSAPTLLTPLV